MPILIWIATVACILEMSGVRCARARAKIPATTRYTVTAEKGLIA
jgi:hypothetical protein